MKAFEAVYTQYLDGASWKKGDKRIEIVVGRNFAHAARKAAELADANGHGELTKLELTDKVIV